MHFLVIRQIYHRPHSKKNADLRFQLYCLSFLFCKAQLLSRVSGLNPVLLEVMSFLAKATDNNNVKHKLESTGFFFLFYEKNVGRWMSYKRYIRFYI